MLMSMGKLVPSTAVVALVVLGILSVVGTSVLVSGAVLVCGVVVISSVVLHWDMLVVNSPVLGAAAVEVSSAGVVDVGHEVVKSRMDVIGAVVWVTAVDSNAVLVSDSHIAGSVGGSVELHSVNINKGQLPYEGLYLSNEYVYV